jgi:3-ketosteroid 9alpha-monooxygenase subunit B
VIFRRDLDALAREKRDRLRVVHTLTREAVPVGREEDVRTGRVTLELLRELVLDPKASIVYACGPAISTWDRLAAKEAGTTPTPRFMETSLHLPRELGVPADRIHRESYG